MKPSEHVAPKLFWADALCLVGLTLTLLIFSYLQSRGRMFWGDEMVGDYVLRAGSFHRGLYLWREGIDSSGAWFYVFGKPWEWIFGPSELSLRMFSAAGVATAATLLWLAARRFYSLPITVVSVFLPLFDVYVTRWQLSNGRSYGLFLAASALVILLLALGESRTRLTPSFIVITFFAYDILAGSHILGSLYAGTFLLLQVALDIKQRRSLRWGLYATAAAGIAVVTLIGLPNIKSTMAVGKPVFWTVRPLLRNALFWGPMTEGAVRMIVLVLFAMAAFAFRRRKERDFVYMLLGTFFLLHSLIFVVSRVTTSIYVDRYLIPFVLAVAFLISELLTQISDNPSALPHAAGAVIAIVGLVGIYNCWPPSQMPWPQKDYTLRVLHDLPTDLPVIDTDVGSFTEIEFYHHGTMHQPFFFPIDDEVTADRTNPGGVSGFNEMNNFLRVGIDAPDLQPTERLLSRYKTFVVVTAQPATSWMAKRVLADPGAHVSDLGVHTYGLTQLHFWQVSMQGHYAPA